MGRKEKIRRPKDRILTNNEKKAEGFTNEVSIEVVSLRRPSIRLPF